MAARSETIAIRAGEEIAAVALADYLRGKIEGAEQGVRLEQFPNGHSNLTYLLRTGGREYVLRRPPQGPVAPKAHDMVREYHVLRAVNPYFREAPRVHLLCEDAEVLGVPFFLMERRHGVVLREEVPAEFEAAPEHPRMIGAAFLETLARLHAVDIAAPELARLGKPGGYVERQLRGWAERWELAKTEQVSDLDAVVRWLTKNVPAPEAPTLIHNDYKLDNILMDAESPGRVEAVLDWEMATLGDPLSDLGLTLSYWVWASGDDVRTAGIPALTRRPGWWSRDELVERYARLTGRGVGAVRYYEVLGVFKLAVIVQQIYARFHRGQTGDERFREFGTRAAALGRLAGKLAER
jgi:aminoglycoside phosphotransferase (APT) family kinase protein